MIGKNKSSEKTVTLKTDITIEREVYESMEEISSKLGMDIHSWVRHVLLSKVKGNRH